MTSVQIIASINTIVRTGMRSVARVLHHLTKGRLTPDMVTIAGCVMHVPIALLIAWRHYYLLAALLLLIFGLFDTLDGELARLQERSSARGMLLDASTDRFKEVLLYTGIAYALACSNHPATAAFAAAACGASISVSYVKAKGEAAVAATKDIPHGALNRLFKDGLLTFEFRIILLIIGVAVNQLAVVAAIIAILAGYTALQRLVRISKALA
jgi:CDP-diacylglycerol--glycerol-3-phosphate 3-phosphatidyltransferase